MLSNSATPRYYGEFRNLVISGEIPVNKEISMEMNRIDDNIRNPNLYYDDEAVEGFIRYCEKELTLTDGSSFEMLFSFKLWAESIFGWYHFIERSVYKPNPEGRGGKYIKRRIKRRLCNKLFLIVGRGAAKSIFASFVQSYFLVMDMTTTYQITTAPTMKQADEVMSPIRTSIVRAIGPLFKLLTLSGIQKSNLVRNDQKKLFSSKEGIENTLTGSKLQIRPMRIDKLQGMRCKVATVDEWLSGAIREDPIGAIEQSAAKVDDYLIIAMSSEGTVRNGSGDDIKFELLDILKGEYPAPHVSIWYYRLDNIEEIADPSMWPKANPNIGDTVSYETYQLDVERAEKVPAARNDIVAKRFGIPVEGFTYFFTYEETLPFKKREYWQLPCSMGADLSRGDDFCSFSFLFPLGNETFGHKSRNYISEATLMKLPIAMRNKYEQFMKEGSLIVMDGTTLKIPEIYDDLDTFIMDNQYDVRSFGYDPYYAKQFVERYIMENGEFGVVKVPQGIKTESVPLGDIKNLVEDKKLWFDEEIMSFAMGNAMTMEDTNGGKKLIKKANDKKIDVVASTMDAYIAYTQNIDMYE